jgi:putative tryptophan/tyrosine transport system substrate-binding protein
MIRREFITLLGGVAAWPLAARAQQGERMRRVGFLAFGTVSAWANRIEALRVSLRELGYVEGQNIAIESAERKILSNCLRSPLNLCA